MLDIPNLAQKMADVLTYLIYNPCSSKTQMARAIGAAVAALEPLQSLGWIVTCTEMRGKRWSITASAPNKNRYEACFRAISEGSKGKMPSVAITPKEISIIS